MTWLWWHRSDLDPRLRCFDPRHRRHDRQIDHCRRRRRGRHRPVAPRAHRRHPSLSASRCLPCHKRSCSPHPTPALLRWRPRSVRLRQWPRLRPMCRRAESAAPAYRSASPLVCATPKQFRLMIRATCSTSDPASFCPRDVAPETVRQRAIELTKDCSSSAGVR